MSRKGLLPSRDTQGSAWWETSEGGWGEGGWGEPSPPRTLKSHPRPRGPGRVLPPRKPAGLTMPCATLVQAHMRNREPRERVLIQAWARD